MNLSKSLANAMRYVSEAAVRILAPAMTTIQIVEFNLLKVSFPKVLNRENEQPFRQFLVSSAQAFSLRVNS